MMTRMLSSKERFALGQERRQQMRRVDHKTWKASARREDPLVLLEASTQGRVPALVAMKNQLMAVSPFGYFRGAVPVMAYDLSLGGNTGICNQLCGDAHVRNLGVFAAPDGRLVFDINDYDETIVGPFEWDVKRLATSLLLAGRAAGVKRAVRARAVETFTARYRRSMRVFAEMPVIELARFQVHRLGSVEPVASILRTAERATPEKSQAKWTEIVDGKRQFKSQPPLLERVSTKEADLVLAALGPYARTLQPERRHFLEQYRALDVGFKVVGTGSVGLRDYCVYFEGAGPRDPLFLQVKEETNSAYHAYLPEGASGRAHNGHRAMDGQRAMQLTSDPFLGYTTLEGRDYLVRQLNDHKASLDITTLTPQGLLGYADLCGELFARGHARGGDPVAIAGYLGNSGRFDEAILGFARVYADKTEANWELLKKAMKKGKA